jgi:hypothetical protein
MHDADLLFDILFEHLPVSTLIKLSSVSHAWYKAVIEITGERWNYKWKQLMGDPEPSNYSNLFINVKALCVYVERLNDVNNDQKKELIATLRFKCETTDNKLYKRFSEVTNEGRRCFFAVYHKAYRKDENKEESEYEVRLVVFPLHRDPKQPIKIVFTESTAMDVFDDPQANMCSNILEPDQFVFGNGDNRMIGVWWDCMISERNVVTLNDSLLGNDWQSLISDEYNRHGKNISGVVWLPELLGFDQIVELIRHDYNGNQNVPARGINWKVDTISWL